jgi:hypothetical protein
MNTSMGLAKKFTSGVVIQFTLTDVIIFRSFKIAEATSILWLNGVNK